MCLILKAVCVLGFTQFFSPSIKRWVGFSLILVLLWHLFCIGLLKGTGITVTGDRECPPGFPFAIFILQLQITLQPNGLRSAAHHSAHSVAQALGTSWENP